MEQRTPDQGCVDRWNQMHMTVQPTVAIVEAKPRCIVTLAYTVSLEHGAGECAPFVRRRSMCVDPGHGFRCVVNRYGAYECPTHAASADMRRANARVMRRGRLVLDAAPSAQESEPGPRWVTRYPVVDGFIIPWTSRGNLRPGLRLTPEGRARCSPISEKTRRPGALRCSSVGGHAAYDPCFVRRRLSPSGAVIVACARAPGARLFVRLTVAGSSLPVLG
jgi:hypothetical protein